MKIGSMQQGNSFAVNMLRTDGVWRGVEAPGPGGRDSKGRRDNRHRDTAPSARAWRRPIHILPAAHVPTAHVPTAHVPTANVPARVRASGS